MADKYSSMTELMNDPSLVRGTDWDIETLDSASNIISLAVHGGGIEPGTTELGRVLAEKGTYNFFSFVAKLSSGNVDLHVTSTRYDAPEIINKIQDSKHSISIHGASGDEALTYMGGGNTALKNLIWTYLEEKGFKCLESPGNLAGVEPLNIANRTTLGKGVQLELSSQQRKDFFERGNWGRANRDNRDTWTTAMYDYAEAIYQAIEEYQKREIELDTQNYYYPLLHSLDYKVI